MATKSKEQILKEVDAFGMYTKRVDFIPTGIPMIDCFFSGNDEVVPDVGGFPRGKMISISGLNGLGKSTLTLFLMKHILRGGFKVIWVDIEDALNEKTLASYKVDEYVAKELKQYFNGDKPFYIYNPETYGNTITTLNDICTHQKPDMIIIDSYKAVRKKSTQDLVDIEDPGAMLASKKTEGMFFPALKDICREYNVCLIGLQQVSLNSKGMLFYNDEPQGNAFLHWHDQRYMLKKMDTLEKQIINNLGVKEKKDVGNVIKLLSKKNRFGMRSLTLPLFFGRGISFIYLYYMILLNNKYIEHNKSSGSKIFKIPGILDGGIDEKTGKPKGVIASSESKMYSMMNEKYSEIEQFIYDQGLIYIEKPVDVDEGGENSIF